jgi:DUF2946 family protein
MDEIVLRAMQKWPKVPSVYGWLALDRRGNWSIKGERIVNPAITEFIGRNYARDDQGRWYFQNGPQKVFVSLAYTPFVFRTQRDSARTLNLVAHTGIAVDDLREAFLDEVGALLVNPGCGVGLIDDRDLPEILSSLLGPDGEPLDDSAIERLLQEKANDPRRTGVRLHLGSHAVPVSFIDSTDVAARFSFDPDPRPAPGEPEC